MATGDPPFGPPFLNAFTQQSSDLFWVTGLDLYSYKGACSMSASVVKFLGFSFSAVSTCAWLGLNQGRAIRVKNTTHGSAVI